MSCWCPEPRGLTRTRSDRHFIQDIGAFQFALGAVLLLVATWPTRDALGLGLLGIGIGSLAHLIAVELHAHLPKGTVCTGGGWYNRRAAIDFWLAEAWGVGEPGIQWMATDSSHPGPKIRRGCGMAIATGSRRDGHVPPLVQSFLHTIENDPRTDQVAQRVEPLAASLNAGPRGALLRGQHIGHALHPVLTDLPIGCWTAASLLDLLGGRRSAPAAQRLIGLGLLTVPPTVMTGLVDWERESQDPRIRRVGMLHALANTVAAGLYVASWNSRRSGSRGRGIVLALMGGGVASVAGYLGAHLSFARGAGQGPRGMDAEIVPSESVDDGPSAGSELGDEVGAAMSGIDTSDPPS